MRSTRSILFVSHYTNLHGANRSLLALVCGLKNIGFVKPLVVCPKEGAMTEALKKNGIDFECLPIFYAFSKKKNGRVRRLFQNLTSVFIAVFYLRKWNFDGVYSNSLVIPWGAFYALFTGKKHIWHLREFGEKDFDLKPDWDLSFYRYFLSRAKLIAVSKAVSNEILTFGLTSEPLVIYNGIASRKEWQRLKDKSVIRVKNTMFTFILVGQINENKNQNQAIEAIEILNQEYPNIRLQIVGDDQGTYARDLKLKSAKLIDEGKVEFLGYHHEPISLMQNADCVLMCSKWEAMGRVTVEAMFAGRPVIGLANSGTLELIQDRRNGLLYDGSTTDLVRAMQEMLSNEILALSLGDYAQAVSAPLFFEEDYVQKIAKTLAEELP